MNEDIRWMQRFQNFVKAYLFLSTGLTKDSWSELERASILHAYEYNFELVWKTLKDCLVDKEVPAIFPRDVIKEVFRYFCTSLDLLLQVIYSQQWCHLQHFLQSAGIVSDAKYIIDSNG